MSDASADPLRPTLWGPDDTWIADPPDLREPLAGATPGNAAPLVEVRRSHRRTKTVSAHREGDTIVLLVPARLSRAEEEHWVKVMVGRLSSRQGRQRRSDSRLAARAAELSGLYLGGRAKPQSVRWVDNMSTRWGSCTPADGSLRLSRRLKDMPGWVVDYVLLHELTHLLELGHGPRFWRLLGGYPRLERARGYLMGVAAASCLDLSDE